MRPHGGPDGGDNRPLTRFEGRAAAARASLADLMKRIAARWWGGLATSFLLELTAYPAIFAIWKKRSLPESWRTVRPALSMRRR